MAERRPPRPGKPLTVACDITNCSAACVVEETEVGPSFGGTKLLTVLQGSVSGRTANELRSCTPLQATAPDHGPYRYL